MIEIRTHNFATASSMKASNRSGIFAFGSSGPLIGLCLIGISIAMLHCGSSLTHPVRQKLTEDLDTVSAIRATRAEERLLNTWSPFGNVYKGATVLSPRNYSNILFVHVGKAGGETVKNILRFGCESRANREKRNSCLKNLPGSQLSDTVKGYLHVNNINPSKAARSAQAYLYNLRHPLDRTISWYYYSSPGSCSNKQGQACSTAQHIRGFPNGWAANFFQTCFPRFEDLVRAFNHSHSNPNCTLWGQSTLAGRETEAGHVWFNIRRYANRTVAVYPDKDVLVVRTERMWDDLKELDIYLGGKGVFGELEGLRVTHGSERWNSTRPTLTDAEARLLCCRLRDEMAVYRDLVGRAINLKDNAKEDTLNGAVKRCGASTWTEIEDGCPS